MAGSRKSSRNRSQPADLAARLFAQLVPVVSARARLAVGLSGGVDSIVLLDCLRRIAARLRIRLSALHVNHQLHPNARLWEVFCRRQCRARGIPYASVKVRVASGESVEAAARAARYAAFARQRVDCIVLAHNQDDQVETLLLQLLRGAGVRGLAAMPLVRMVDGGGRMAEGNKNRAIERGSSSLIPHPSSLQILRPLLDVTRAEILDYARARRLEWIEDDSNANLDFRRNFLRHEVLPLIDRRFPSYRTTVARSARHLAEASAVLDELAAQDAADGFDGTTLAVGALRGLSDARARNVLRFFLASRGVSMPNVERLEEALRQVLTARQDARVAIALAQTTLRRHRDRLYLVPELPPLPRRFARSWAGEPELALPALGGILRMERTRGEGISVARLGKSPLTVRVRRGGERLQTVSGRPRRSLKNLLQESQIPPWKRGNLPLLFCGDRLIWVPGIGVACDFHAGPGEVSIRPRWLWQEEAA